jgi:hypothetical protein
MQPGTSLRRSLEHVMQGNRAYLLAGRSRRRSLIGDPSGFLVVEALLALMLIAYFFFFTWLIGELAAADLVLARAASAASREAAVVLADDERFYGGQAVLSTGGERRAAVEAVARRVLSAASSFESSSLQVELALVSGPEADVVLLDTTLTAKFRCMGGSLAFVVCGVSGLMTFRATARNVVHAARYQYALATPPNRTAPASCAPRALGG